MNTSPDPRAVARWLWNRYLTAWLLAFVPVTLAGILTGAYLMPFDDANMGYMALMSILLIFLIASIFLASDTLIERYRRWKRWDEYIHSDLRAQALKEFAREVITDYWRSHPTPADTQDA